MISLHTLSFLHVVIFAITVGQILHRLCAEVKVRRGVALLFPETWPYMRFNEWPFVIYTSWALACCYFVYCNATIYLLHT